MLKIAAAALSGFFIVSAAQTQEAGECISVEEADRLKDENGDMIVAHIPQPPVGVFFLIKRRDGTFKEVFASLGQVCHVQDFIGDPRLKGASL